MYFSMFYGKHEKMQDALMSRHWFCIFKIRVFSSVVSLVYARPQFPLLIFVEECHLLNCWNCTLVFICDDNLEQTYKMVTIILIVVK